MNTRMSTLLVLLAGCTRLSAPSGSAGPGADFAVRDLTAQGGGAEGATVPTSLTSLVCLETELCANVRDDDMDGTTDEECGPCDAYATRGLHWWRGHECVISGEATGYALYPITIGGGAVTLADADAVIDFLFAPSTGDQRALSLGIVVAKLNIAAFGIGDTPFADYDGDGDLETVQEIVDAAERVWTEGTSDSEYLSMITLLSRMNGQGLDTPAWFDEECTGDIEICNRLDDDADGSADEGCLCLEERDGYDNDFDGTADDGYADTDGDGTADCFDVETCDGLDNDGDGVVDNGWDDDGDGWAECMGDCLDSDPDVHPDAVDDDCDRMDDDCDGLIDEDMTVSHSSTLPIGTPPPR